MSALRLFFFFFNDPAPPEFYPLPLHDALPIYFFAERVPANSAFVEKQGPNFHERGRSEEHTSELQSRQYLVCRLLLEKKKQVIYEIAGDVTPADFPLTDLPE